jgi:hypothetical protein
MATFLLAHFVRHSLDDSRFRRCASCGQYNRKKSVIILFDMPRFDGVAETNGAIPAAKVSAAIPDRAFKGMSAMVFLRRLWTAERESGGMAYVSQIGWAVTIRAVGLSVALIGAISRICHEDRRYQSS